MARKLFALVALMAVVALTFAAEADKPAEEKKEGDVEGRIGFGSGFRNVQGGNQASETVTATAPTPVSTRATSTAMVLEALVSLVASTVVPVVSTTSTGRRVDSTAKRHRVKTHLE
ncbi:hypothetical protein ISCGN_015306 [Ixodes scapularis]